MLNVFFLTPDRFYRNSTQRFRIDTRLQVAGHASGWTGLYHPIWHADNKWSKCWETKRVTAFLSTGEVLDSDAKTREVFFLENEFPVGQASISLTEGWIPSLAFNADLRELRNRGVSIGLEMAIRYDFQLEGSSDLWLRARPGSMTESVPAFDNAVTIQMHPGAVVPI